MVARRITALAAVVFLLSGLVLFLIGTAVSAAAQTVAMLAIGRLVQAIGAGCAMTLVRVIARDAYRAESPADFHDATADCGYDGCDLYL